MGSVFTTKAAEVPIPTLEEQLREQQEYHANLRAQLSFKCNKEEKADACHYYGEFLMAMEKSKEPAREVLSKNCYKCDYDPSCMALGQSYLATEGDVERDVTEALKHFDHACKKKNASACMMSGIMRAMGMDGDIKQDLPKSLGYFDKACEYGDKAGCYQAGMMARYAPAPCLNYDYEKALSAFSKACESGSLSSCKEVAIIYERGLGVPPNPQKAHQYYCRAIPRFQRDIEE